LVKLILLELNTGKTYTQAKHGAKDLAMPLRQQCHFWPCLLGAAHLVDGLIAHQPLIVDPFGQELGQPSGEFGPVLVIKSEFRLGK
jgi:hypothetical protein